MNKFLFLFIFVFLFISNTVYAYRNYPNEYPKASFKTNRNSGKYGIDVDVSMSYVYKLSNPHLKSTENTVNSVLIKGKVKYIDFYGYIDIYDAFFLFDDKKYVFGQINNYLFGEIVPRISLSDVTKYDLTFGIFNDLYLAYNFTFDSQDILHHYFGVGADFSFSFVERLNLNLYSRYIQKNYGRYEDQFSGGMFDIEYEIPIYRFKFGLDFIYSGRFKLIFLANAKGRYADETDLSIKWKNMFKIGYKGFYVGYTYEYNKDNMEIKSAKTNNGEQTVGIYYTVHF